ncbi:DUF397 domain-containing protein [Streptomyces litchfieldiae]|uniref:DUF397 domain-containing protein n=1 Tax=Streptomyces litchfieldiae TaxID=3075543 RepID=A0ABU2MWB0_9ACTN|nr:DUF397 domain-containing protein [Streptomyces sp. DSM 44938]MDT0345936.1 DUF397 domain-containing protein [Streptomyces sp. DSM 44938]
MASDLRGACWVTSSYSNGGGNCVEVAGLTGTVAVRDSKAPHGPVLLLASGHFAAFIADVRAGRYDV